MGRYYKTANPQNIDFMYKLPEQYMLAAVQQASQDITQNQAALYDMYGKLQLNALAKDKPRAKQILDSYESAINELSADLQADPLAFRAKGGDILGLSRQLHKDFTKGEAAAIQSNYNVDAQWQTEYDKLAREGKLEHSNWIQSLRYKNLERYKGVGYNESTGNYNIYDPEDLVNYVDIDKELDEKVKEIQLKINASASAYKEGEFIREVGKTTQKREADDILRVAMEEFYSDPKIQTFIKQGSDIGMLSGYYNKDVQGNLNGQISPFKVDEKGNYVTDKEGNYVENAESTALRKFKSLVTRYQVDNVTEAHNRLKNLPVKGTGTTRNPGDPSPAMIDGNLDINPIGYVPASNTPSTNILTKAKDLKNIENHKVVLQKAYSNIDLKDFKDNAKAKEIITKVGAAVKNGDTVELNALLKDLPNSGWAANMKLAVKTIEEDKIEAHNMEAQVAAYEKLAKDLNATNGTFVTADQLMNQAKSFVVPLEEDRGEYYDYKPEHQEIFTKVLKDVETFTDKAYELGHSMIVMTQDATGKSTVEEITSDEFNKRYATTDEAKRGKKEESQNGISNGINGATTNIVKRPSLTEAEGGTGLKSVGKVGEHVQMVEGKLAYTYQERNSDGTPKSSQVYTKVLVQPFTRKLETADGKRVTIVIPREKVDSNDLRFLDITYEAKNEVRTKTTDINNMVRGIKKIAEVNNIIFTVPIDFKLNDDVAFRPNTTGVGIGSYKLKGIQGTPLEDEDIFDEYAKTMR